MSTREAVQRYETACRALVRNLIEDRAAGIIWQTPKSRELVRDVWEAEPGVSWWRRRLADRRVRLDLTAGVRCHGEPPP